MSASREWSERPAPWVGGVISALAWVSDEGEGPYSTGSGASEHCVSIENDVAHHQATDGPMPDHRDYGAAVSRTLEWLSGAPRPVPLRCDYYDDSEVAEGWRIALAAGDVRDPHGVSDYRQLAQQVLDTRFRVEETWDEAD